MGILRRNYNRPNVETELYSRRSSRLLSRFAIALSTVAIIFSSLTLARVFILQREVEELENSIEQLTTAPSPTATTSPSNPIDSNIPTPPPAVALDSTAAPSPTATLEPGRFVQPALSNKAQVQLIQVNRIPGQFDVVNIQMRIRALEPNIPLSDIINLNDTTASNPGTNETYKVISGESTGIVSLGALQSANQTTVDAYVWLQVPMQVNAIDIYIPNTEPFKNVPIAS
ncbi:hypothetical protein [Chroococcidiopsis sp. TS-821]|uniref:hypothetical protein n=1 Tax=Chroococcidiopsis sp. TS-821 TaxID=1378066 RepID=UPI0011B079C6|nr:hypothetical protein [Chroococcidiopsis sp. TS-821]